jgi:uncharacterized tellurite resistance protein B-like protein
VFEAFKSFVADLAGDRHLKFAPDDYRVAAAALLVHAASIENGFSDSERDRLRGLLKRRFDLDDAAADMLVAQATAAEHDAVDLYHFTRLLNRKLDEEGRRRIVEMLWEISYVDGHVSDFEQNLIWRVADLLGISSRERIALRQRVATMREGNGP